MFLKKLDIDMIGMGPYLPHPCAPLAQAQPFDRQRNLGLGLKMIALARLMLTDVNIASTTALQALHEDGILLGIDAGANVVMPNMTPLEYRASYQLYQNKPRVDESRLQWLKDFVEARGDVIGFGEFGDAPHFLKRTYGLRSIE